MKIKIILIISTLFICMSCSDFLDVTSKDKQTEAQMYNTKSGFYIASNGIYNGLASDALYGKSLSFEAIDIMAHRYTVASSNTYYLNLLQNNYTYTYCVSALSSIWAKAYSVILASNILIDNIRKQSGVLNDTESSTMEGEMLAVRAFLHFDMLRLFGPRWNNNPDELAIPYNESAEVQTLPLLSFKAVIDKILVDLDNAEKLLAKDPVIEKGPMASIEDNESVQLRYRQFRFNYYAVEALKARVYLYAGQKENALTAAKAVIEDENVQKNFPAVDGSKLLANYSNPDRVFSSEVLTGIYLKTRDNIYTNYFSTETASTYLLQPYSNFVPTLFSSLYGLLGSMETGDYRFQSQWQAASGVNATGYIFTKYKSIDKPDASDEDSEYFYSRMIPLIRLSEMYYIAAECEPNYKDGFKWLNIMRVRRGLSPLATGYDDAIHTYGYFDMFLANEYIREFTGEGQLFYFFKRKAYNQSYDNGVQRGYVMYSETVYRPQLPDGETK